ncbi:MAG: endonuclease/exonuclease/phosphatase family protein [Acidobacteria bacterium]|nr:endonuclease/exonuclease/phosphatase family protein [Acidobacteriota bacterium]
MRRLGVALPVMVLTVVAATSGRWAATAPEPKPTFRVATWNIHKGADRRGTYHLEHTIDAIARFGADLVGLQEVMRNQLESNCDDQPALVAEGLRWRTGQPWAHVYVKAWISEKRYCQERGRGDGVETEGLALFAAEPIVVSRSTRLPESRVAVEVRLASLPDVPVLVTHLAPNRENQALRVRQFAALLPWAAGRGPGILIGDLNAEPDASELAPVLARYRDAWAEATAKGVTRGVATGQTRPHRVSRIDYILYAPDIGLTLESVEVIDTSTLGLGEVSDHNPVVATFRRTRRQSR